MSKRQLPWKGVHMSRHVIIMAIKTVIFVVEIILAMV